MKVLKQALGVLGTVVVIAIIAALVTPKTAHALVGAFVQVVNTPTNAVPTIQAPAAAKLYQAFCGGVYSPGSFDAICSFPPVPVGETLFVESFSALSQSFGGDPVFVILEDNNPTGTYHGGYFLPMSQQFSGNGVDTFAGLGGRTTFGFGTNPRCRAKTSTNATNGELLCEISGYLAPAN